MMKEIGDLHRPSYRNSLNESSTGRLINSNARAQLQLPVAAYEVSVHQCLLSFWQPLSPSFSFSRIFPSSLSFSYRSWLFFRFSLPFQFFLLLQTFSIVFPLPLLLSSLFSVDTPFLTISFFCFSSIQLLFSLPPACSPSSLIPLMWLQQQQTTNEAFSTNASAGPWSRAPLLLPAAVGRPVSVIMFVVFGRQPVRFLGTKIFKKGEVV